MLHRIDLLGKFQSMRLITPLLAVFLSSACSLPRWPVAAPLSSPYGLRFLGWRPDIHEGVDLPVPVGTAVTAVKSGTVAFAGEQRSYGLVIQLAHGANLRTLYAHLSRLNVRTGQRVAAGQLIGWSGRSGNATGAHLHFEIRRWGKSEDPVQLLGEPPD